MEHAAFTIENWLGRTLACECGKAHSVPLRHVVLEQGALNAIPDYVQQAGHECVTIVADRQTYKAAGERLASLLKQSGLEVAVSILEPDELGDVVADEAAIVRVMLDTPPKSRAMLAVGSGTIHDIVRFVCSQTCRAFLSVPTAPSVDGFASVGAPLLIGGFKMTIPACSPEAIFADLDVLAAAPRPMIAAGFGDMLGKYTSLADWRLGRLLLDEAYCRTAADMTEAGLRFCVENADEIARGTVKGIRRLMEGLILSGISMLLVGHSRPASGGEHHLSHFWEMKLIEQKRKALLHGAKVGVACVLMARLYERVGALTPEEAGRRIAAAAPLTAAADSAAIRRAYGAMADSVIRENFPGGASEPAEAGPGVAALAAARWADVVAIARSVPAAEQLAGWLRQAGGPQTTGQLGIGPELVEASLRDALFVRSRFTIMRLMRMLGE